MDVRDPGRAVPLDQLPRRPHRRRALRGGDGDLADHPGGVRRAGTSLPRRHRGDDAHPGHGREHRVRRLPPAGRAAGRRRLPAPAAHLPRQPARLLARDRGPRPRGLAPDLGLRRERHRPHPALRDRRLPLVHAVAGGHGPPLAEVGPAGARRGAGGAGLHRPPRPALGVQDGAERVRRLPDRGRHRGVRGDEVPRRGLGGPGRDPGAGRRLLHDPPALQGPRAAAVAREVRPAAPGGPAPGHHPDQRRPPRGGGRADLRARPLRGRHRGLRLDRPRPDRGGGEEVGAVGRGSAAGRRQLALPAAGRAARGLHPPGGGAAAAERGDHGGGAAVRAAPAVAQRAARADRDDAPPGAGLRAGRRDHQRSLPGGPRGREGGAGR